MKDDDWQALELFADTYCRNIAIIALDRNNVNAESYARTVMKEENWVIKHIITPGSSYLSDCPDEPVIFLLYYAGYFASLQRDTDNTKEFPTMRQIVALIEADSFGSPYHGVIHRGFRL